MWYTSGQRRLCLLFSIRPGTVVSGLWPWWLPGFSFICLWWRCLSWSWKSLLRITMTKVIKIQEHYRQRGKWDRSFRKVPKIILSGDWLAEAGFIPSKMVRVECVNNQLIVTSIDWESTPALTGVGVFFWSYTTQIVFLLFHPVISWEFPNDGARNSLSS